MITTTDSIWEASYFHYTYGEGALVSVSTSGRSASYRFDIPQHDIPICQDEMKSESTSLFFVAFCRSIKACQHYASLARKDFSGYWTAGKQA
jgi:hypothetical protein